MQQTESLTCSILLFSISSIPSYPSWLISHSLALQPVSFSCSLLGKGIWYKHHVRNAVLPFWSILFLVTLLVVYVSFQLQMILILRICFRELDLAPVSDQLLVSI